MQVFKAFMKIYKRSVWTVALYLGIFLGMVILIDSMTQPPTIDSFADKKVNVAVVDHDNSTLSRALTEYLKQTQNLAEVEEDMDALQDAMFFRKVEYLITIPEGFAASLSTENEKKLSTTKVPGSYSGIFIDMQVEEFLTTFRSYELAGQDMETALQSAIDNQSIHVEVSVLTQEGAAEKVHDFAFYFQLLPYGMLSIVINLMAIELLAFNRQELARRNRCASLPLYKKNLQMILGGAVVAVTVWVIIMLAAFLLYGKTLIESGMLGWISLNSAAFTLVSIGVAYLIGVVAKEKTQISGLCTTVAMVFCFLGGVFVGIDLMSEGVQKVADLIPTRWYVRANDIIGTSGSLSGENRNTVLLCLLIQCLFAVVFFSIALVVGKKRSGRE